MTGFRNQFLVITRLQIPVSKEVLFCFLFVITFISRLRNYNAKELSETYRQNFREWINLLYLPTGKGKAVRNL